MTVPNNVPDYLVLKTFADLSENNLCLNDFAFMIISERLEYDSSNLSSARGGLIYRERKTMDIVVARDELGLKNWILKVDSQNLKYQISKIDVVRAELKMEIK